VELVFDTGLGVYVVVGHPNHYYHEDHFYRLTGSVWEMSLKIDGGWAFVSGKPLPPGLRTKGSGRFKNQGKVVGRGKDKRKK